MADLQGTKLKLAYTLRGLARAIGGAWDHRKLGRILKKGGVVPRPDGLIWICDIRDEMPQFLKSWAELIHQNQMSQQGSNDDDEDPESGTSFG